MINRYIPVFFLALSLFPACVGTRQSVQVGQVQLDAMEPLDNQGSLGWVSQSAGESTGLGYEVGIQYASDSAYVSVPGVGSASLTSRNLELWGGGRYEIVQDNIRPYASVGLSVLQAELEAGSGIVSDNDTSLGVYLGVGVDLDISESVFLGFGIRQAFHQIELFGASDDADFTQLFVRFGTTF